MIENNQYSRVCARINLKAIEHNLLAMKNNIPDGTRIMAVIKTDAYGHGAVEIGRFLEGKDYIWGYAVATAEEAFELRDAGLSKPILILGYTFPYAYERMIREDIRPAVFRLDTAKELNAIATKLLEYGEIKEPAPIHIAVDTGMSRIGITPDDDGVSFAKEVRLMTGLHIEGVFTHFARADEEDLTNVREREEVFKSFLMSFEEETGYRIPIKHCANSASIIAVPESSMDMVRAGVTMYGMWPSDEVPRDIISLEPAMELLSHIVMVKEVPAGTPVSYGGTFVTDKPTRIATIPVGYGDGYPRSLSGKGYVLINGHHANILGRVCMDQFMVDVTDVPYVKEGDEVVLMGKDKTTGEEITAEYLGDLSGRFNYELTCDISKRVPRLFINK
ncbi:alanine racemase [Butyrivibrio sp. CB08]|uniref:alanine racemase n=1 Tax=Butyrivibrio sp. CB08 TaxID=2364879 RepID=UPI000EAAC238|nr:alanine racemase [Butyrivibrio sp. CB08]RKM56008.1 alanine racemase [Butyrivibrio sp. CB08]